MDYKRMQIDTYEEQRVTFVDEFDGAPVLEHGYRRKTRWIPTSLRVTFERHRETGTEWSSWRVNSGRLNGRNLRADGSEGAEHFERIAAWGRKVSLPDAFEARFEALRERVDRYGVAQPDPAATDLDA